MQCFMTALPFIYPRMMLNFQNFFVHDTVDLRSALNSQSFSSELSAIPYSVLAYF